MAKRGWGSKGLPLAVVLSLAGACVGTIGDTETGSGGPVVPPGVEDQAPTTAIPRLSRREIDATIEDVFGIAGAAEKYLPADPDIAVNPNTRAEEEVFDTASATKTPSQVFVDGLESLAFAVARDFTADTAAVDALAGCSPSEPTDGACLSELIRKIGLRLWRRPLTDDEVDALIAEASPFATDPAAGADGFYVAARAAIAGLIVSPELVYRSEIGNLVGERVVALDDYELVSRLSYFLWGTTPTPELLDAAAAGDLTGQALESLVDDMLDDPRADEQMRTFHELWLRYARLLVADEQLASAMRAETDALVGRALKPGSWAQLFTSTSTFVDGDLASHYGLSSPSEPGWVEYEGRRAGLLSHGSFLSLSQTKMTQTLPSRRGAMIGRRLLCEVILPPPPDVAADMGVEVPDGACKTEAYEAHANGGCKACHAIIDGIGFGFERFDGLGRYREVEAENPSCDIEGVGTTGGEAFSGPVEFSERNLDVIATCAVQHLLRFAVRDWAPSVAWLERLDMAFVASAHDFRVLVRTLVLSPEFRHRVEEAEAP